MTANHRLPTNTTTDLHAVHRWFNFIAGFSPEFVQACLVNAGLGSGDTLLDPFAGIATALVEANRAGLESIGYEPHPFFYDMGRAKIETRDLATVEEVECVLRSVVPIHDYSALWGLPASTFLEKLIDHDNLSWLAGARAAEIACEPSARLLYRLVVSRLLESAAGSATDGIYKAPTTRKRSVTVSVALVPLLEQIRADVAGRRSQGRGVLAASSSERMLGVVSDSVAICVTSPPYLNNFDFAEMTRMELYFWDYASSWADITNKVRSRLILNTTTAPAAMRRRHDIWRSRLSLRFLRQVDPVRDALVAQRKIRAGRKEYDTLVYPYFAQMQSVIAEIHRVLRDDGPLHLIVADAALYGVHIHTEALLAQLMEEQGFVIENIARLRDRGGRWVLAKRQGSPAPLGEFHIQARKRGHTRAR